MPYLIDGHNLIPRIPGIDLHDPEDEIQLIKLLQDFCRKLGVKIEVYFDNAPAGNARSQKHGQVTAHFVRQGRTADDAIRSRLHRMGRAARDWTVVTSDRQIIAAAREAGANTLSTARFASQLSPAGGEPPSSPEIHDDIKLTPEAIEEWLRLFDSNKKK